jgi:hypothetical protein
MRGFLGLLNLYGSLLQNLQEIVHPLNRALSKETLPNKTLEWSHAMVEAFDRAKELFIFKEFAGHDQAVHSNDGRV